MAHPLHPDSEGVDWWVKKCKSNLLRTQVALIGCDAWTAEEWYMKYGDPEFLTRDELFYYFLWQKQHPGGEFAAWAIDVSRHTFDRIIAKVREYLVSAVDEIRWDDRLCLFNHCPHFPYFVTHFTDSFPIASIGGVYSDVLFNPKYAGCVYKVTLAVDHLGNIVFACILACGNSADVLIWDREGPDVRKGHFFPYECGCHDGAYKGRVHNHCPFIGRKHLTQRQQEYNDVHGNYRARSEHIFARLWTFKIVRDIWTGSSTDLHRSVRILVHFMQFQIRRQTRYQPYGPWEHVPGNIWTDQPSLDPEEDVDDTYLCQMCARRDTVACVDCSLYLCTSCAESHSC